MVVYLLILSQLAIAEDPDPKLLYDNGKILFEEKRYSYAIDAWKQAWEISKKPILLYNIAVAYEEMEEYDEAIDYILKYRSYAAKDEHEFLKEKIQELEQKKAQKEKELEEQKVADAEQKKPEPKEPATMEPEPLEEAKTVKEPVEKIPTNEQPSNKRKYAAYGTWGFSALVLGGSTYYGIKANQITKQFEVHVSNGSRVCKNIGEETYCSDQEVEIENEKSFAQYADAGWAIFAFSTGFSIWLTRSNSKQESEISSAVWVTPSMIGLQGTF
jgi:tetratricopeptide (TPR) repeat protein